MSHGAGCLDHKPHLPPGVRKSGQKRAHHGEWVLALWEGVIVERKHEIEDVRVKAEAASIHQSHGCSGYNAWRYDRDRPVEEVSERLGAEGVRRPDLVDSFHAMVLSPDRRTASQLPIGS